MLRGGDSLPGLGIGVRPINSEFLDKKECPLAGHGTKTVCGSIRKVLFLYPSFTFLVFMWQRKLKESINIRTPY